MSDPSPPDDPQTLIRETENELLTETLDKPHTSARKRKKI